MIAMQQHGGADADGEALHGCDQRLLAAHERMQKADHRLAQAAAMRGDGQEIHQIVAGAERARRARDQQCSGCCLSGAFERIGHRVIHFAVQRVFLVRPVHPDQADGAGVLDEDEGGHGQRRRPAGRSRSQ